MSVRERVQAEAHITALITAAVRERLADPKNRTKGTTWRSMPRSELVEHLLEEVEELLGAVADGDAKAIRDEAGDVGAFLGMLIESTGGGR